jgi:hypothetical protein
MDGQIPTFSNSQSYMAMRDARCVATGLSSGSALRQKQKYHVHSSFATHTWSTINGLLAVDTSLALVILDVRMAISGISDHFSAGFGIAALLLRVL